MIYKTLRYILQALVIYLLLRYVPQINMTQNGALITTIILMAFIFLTEFTCSTYYQKLTRKFNVNAKIDNAENFKEKMVNVNTCNTGMCQSPKPKCRIVCENDKIEHFEEDKQDKQNQEQEQNDKPIITTTTKTNNTYYDGMYYDEYVSQQQSNDISSPIAKTGIFSDQYRSIKEKEERLRTELNQLREYERAIETTGYATPYQQTGSKSKFDQHPDTNRLDNGMLTNEMPYTDYNHLPVASGYKSHDYEYGYSFIPPEKWYPQPTRPPVCVTNSRSVVSPILANGTPVDVKEFDTSRRIMPPDMINTNYINDKLNSGR